MEKIYNCDCIDFLKSNEAIKLLDGKKVVIVTDPPFNSYKSKKKKETHYNMLETVFTSRQYEGLVIIYYPEQLFEIAAKLNKTPTRVISWVYNSNATRQHRNIAYFDIKPNFKQVLQPYKNPNDKRVIERLKKGVKGAKLYDWWNINQVKVNVKQDFYHPYMIPLQVMENAIGLLPKDVVILDPFMGSGTTCVACKELGYDFVGIEINKEYFDLAKRRIENTIRKRD